MKTPNRKEPATAGFGRAASTCSLSSWAVDDLTLAIEFARQRGGDCTLMILYVATQIIEHEGQSTDEADRVAEEVQHTGEFSDSDEQY